MPSKTMPINTTNLSPKQKKLVEKAFQLFLKHGFKRVTVEEICALSQVSKVTFYRHYKGKEELIEFIVGSMVKAVSNDITKIVESNQSIKAKFDKIAIAKQEFSHQIGDEMLRSLMLFPSAVQHLEDFSQQIWGKLNILLEEEQKRGNINPLLDIPKTLKFLMALNNLYNSEEVFKIYDNMDDMLTQINELLVMGLLARKVE